MNFRPKYVTVKSEINKQDYVTAMAAEPENGVVDFVTAPQQGLRMVQQQLGNRAFTKIVIILEVRDNVD